MTTFGWQDSKCCSYALKYCLLYCLEFKNLLHFMTPGSSESSQPFIPSALLSFPCNHCACQLSLLLLKFKFLLGDYRTLSSSLRIFFIGGGNGKTTTIHIINSYQWNYIHLEWIPQANYLIRLRSEVSRAEWVHPIKSHCSFVLALSRIPHYTTSCGFEPPNRVDCPLSSPVVLESLL